MHILFTGYGKTSRRVAKQLFEQGHQISTISQSPKTDSFATHLIQDVHQLDLTAVAPIDWVYLNCISYVAGSVVAPKPASVPCCISIHFRKMVGNV
jgi:3-hydroxyisobutyrate dehydrogenase-like beta-hydroxyacid dehydrogenase